MLMEDKLGESQSICVRDKSYVPQSQILQTNSLKIVNQIEVSSSQGPKRTILIQRLSPTQMDERQAKIFCFNCDEKFHLGDNVNPNYFHSY